MRGTPSCCTATVGSNPPTATHFPLHDLLRAHPETPRPSSPIPAGHSRSPLGISRGCFTAFGLHPRQCRERAHPSRRQGSASPRSSPVRCSPGSAWLCSAAASGLALDPFQAATANSQALVGAQQPCMTPVTHQPSAWLPGAGGWPPVSPQGVAEARSAGRDTPRQPAAAIGARQADQDAGRALRTPQTALRAIKTPSGAPATSSRLLGPSGGLPAPSGGLDQRSRRGRPWGLFQPPPGA